MLRYQTSFEALFCTFQSRKKAIQVAQHKQECQDKNSVRTNPYSRILQLDFSRFAWTTRVTVKRAIRKKLLMLIGHYVRVSLRCQMNCEATGKSACTYLKR